MFASKYCHCHAAEYQEDKEAYRASCKKLAGSFVENFKKYTKMSDEVIAAGPKA